MSQCRSFETSFSSNQHPVQDVLRQPQQMATHMRSWTRAGRMHGWQKGYKEDSATFDAGFIIHYTPNNFRLDYFGIQAVQQLQRRIWWTGFLSNRTWYALLRAAHAQADALQTSSSAFSNINGNGDSRQWQKTDFLKGMELYEML